MNIRCIERFFQRNRLGMIEQNPEKIETGGQHLIWKIQSGKGVFAVKELNPGFDYTKDYRRQFNLSEKAANFFRNNRIPAVPALKIGGRYLQKHDGSFFLVYDYIEGKPLDHRGIKDGHVCGIAEILAGIHNTGLSLKGIQSPARSLFDEVKIEGIPDRYLRYCSRIKEIIEIINGKSARSFSGKIVSHTDLHPGNVIWEKNGSPWLIDWEETSFITKEDDLFTTSVVWSGLPVGKINRDRLSLFIDIYRRYAEGNASAYDYSGSYWNCMGWAVPFLLYNLNKVDGSVSEVEKETAERHIVNQLRTISCLWENRDFLFERFRISGSPN